MHTQSRQMKLAFISEALNSQYNVVLKEKLSK